MAKVLAKAVPWEQDADGRVAITCGGEIEAIATNTPNDVAKRNHYGYEVVKPGDTIGVEITHGDGTKTVVATGDAIGDAGKGCGVYVSVRMVANVPFPIEIVEEP